ncbi:MAG: ABC transporter substrate-binding protein, partial [Candidatus Eremiobacteraeota bacterium]|nr:ABC transporter substrate-binding protein [Candidatus Eremiobacteraeota bacterium]
ALTAVVHLAAPYTPFVRQFETTGRVIPAHAFANAGGLNTSPFNAAPIGTGPFKFVRWIRGDRLELTANDTYYLGRPKIRRVVVRFVPNDSTAIDALLTHEVDWLWNASAFAYRRLRTVPALHVAPIAANVVHGLEMNVTQPPLDDARVRRAISDAIDRAALVRNVAFGSTTAADADLPAFMRRGSGAISGQHYDPLAARALLDRAGWKLRNGERAKGGRTLAFTLAYPAGNATSAAEVVQMQALLGAVGVGVVAKAFDPNQLFAPAQMGGVLEAGKFELDLSGYAQTDDRDDSALFSCANRAPRGANVSRYCSARFEALTAQAIATPDGPKRDALYAQIEQTLAGDAPWAFVWWPNTTQIYDTDFKNFEIAPGRQSLDPQNWSIGTELKHR